jgi:lipoprotein-anchoring transpeptidase ErfK/SrfK
VVRTGERRLYYILPEGRAIRYSVGVGREGFTWSGTDKITRKSMWPEWRPPKIMIERERLKGRMIPAFMEGGVENPLGARALYIGNTEYRIHGTSQPWSIGMAVSSGCIRMLNEEVIDLYNRVDVGATVVVQ